MQNSKNLRILNATTGWCFHANDAGKGTLKMYGNGYNTTCQDFYLQEGPKPETYRIVDRATGFIVHANEAGKGTLKMHNEIDNECQIVKFVPQKNGTYLIQNIYSEWYIHANDAGKGTLKMYPEPNDICQEVYFYEKTQPAI